MSQTNDYLGSLFSLEDKTVLLTGAAGGIGEALGRALASAGASVALCDLALSSCERIQNDLEDSGLAAAAFHLDVTDKASIRACVEAVIRRYGKVDVLVNCAGINKREGFLDVEDATYDRIMSVNLKGVFQLTQEVVKHMLPRGKGSIINIGSHNDEMMLGGCSVYGATKSAVRALTRSMAVEWAKHGIVTWEHPTRGDYLRDRIAMRRPGKPEELAGICIMLASDAASYITGQAYHVDGGCLCGGDPWDFDTKY